MERIVVQLDRAEAPPIGAPLRLHGRKVGKVVKFDEATGETTCEVEEKYADEIREHFRVPLAS